MSHEKLHAAEVRKRVQLNRASAVASAKLCSFNLLSIAAPSRRDQTVRLPVSTTRAAM